VAAYTAVQDRYGALQDRIVFVRGAASDTLPSTIDQGASPMAVLDHHDLPAVKEPNGYLAVCNVSLVFLGVLALAYVLSLFL
jgi:hypothetical protein